MYLEVSDEGIVGSLFEVDGVMFMDNIVVVEFVNFYLFEFFLEDWIGKDIGSVYKKELKIKMT